MAFHVLANGTTASADDVNDNFYWVNQGARLPMGGNSLLPTTGVYDIGSSSARWHTLYCNNLYVSGSITTNKQMYTLISEVTVTATSASISFSGLNGDSEIEYQIMAYTLFAAANVDGRMVINDDTAGNYGVQSLSGISTAVAAARSTGTSWNFAVGTAAVTNTSYMNMTLYAKTGDWRTGIMTKVTDVTGVSVTALYLQGLVYNNTNTTLTTLKLIAEGAASGTAYFQPLTRIRIMGRK